MDELGVDLETAIIRRLSVKLEIIYAPAHKEHAVYLAERIHTFWPQLQVGTYSHMATKGTPRASPFDIVWIERWGLSRTTEIIYTHYNKGPQLLPSDRAVWRELNARLCGQTVA